MPETRADQHSIFLASRAFNRLQLDSLRGTITKRSDRRGALIDEINYLRLVPRKLEGLFPRLVAYSTDRSDPWVRMEYHGYSTLSQVLLFQGLEPAVWQRVFEHLKQIVTETLGRWRRPLPRGAVRCMYFDKTQDRLAELRAPDALVRLIHRPGGVLVNGRSLSGIHDLWARLEDEVCRLEATVTGQIIHGDFCLGNILYDLRSGTCKLVDPRGSFGEAGLFGDPRYDIAKLYHSVYGQYDFIVSDLFEVEFSDEGIAYRILSQARHDEIRRRFEKVFFPAFGRRDVLLITGLLFASMSPLHYDAPRRQAVMLARAIELLNEALALPLL